MDKNAQKTLNDYIKIITDKATYDENNAPVIGQNTYGDIKSASEILLKADKEFDVVELYFLIKEELTQAGKINDTKINVGQIQKKACESIINVLDKYPFNYDVYASLPSVEIDNREEIKITNFISIITLKKSFEDDLLAGFPKLEKDLCYIKIATKGWASQYNEGHLFHEMLGIIKRVIATLYVTGFAENSQFESVRQGLLLPTFVNDPLFLFKNNGFGKSKKITYNLPYDLRNMLSTVTIKNTLFQANGLLSLLLELEKQSPLKIAEAKLKSVKNILSEDNDNTKGIRTALDWYAESLISSNETFQFIFSSIALEALIGTKLKDQSLTYTISDRCAYLLEKKNADRVRIRDKMKHLYEKRSELVHGNVSKLKKNDMGDLNELKKLVSKLIRIEIDNYSPILG